MHIFKDSHFNFLRWRWHALALSALVIAGGIFMMATQGIPLGVEFSGGTIVIARFESSVSEDQVRRAVESLPGEEQVQRFDDAAANQWLIRLPQTDLTEQGSSLSEGADQVIKALQAAGLPKIVDVSTEIVGPTVGAELRRRGISATLLSMIGITAWMAFRFRVSFALGSIAATFHDVLVTLSCLVLFNYEMSLNVIAAMLTMVGYSMNDMIVIFDRVRENARSKKREPLETMINTSLNQTLARTVITSGTVFMAVLALYLFGGDVLKGFAFTMLVGTLATTYSGWFIAPSLAIMMSGTTVVARAPAAAVSEGAAAPQQPTRKSKPQRKAKAS
ncbi:MAG: protein-export membrane protein SecF [Acidobacteria bacterium RIFCSPLOWO2_02_FULL_65_29]|nr:MAG: protein-export membrane protein SecF [Acidobacteria bacterium RIFCSPLOWO2_02_FULL_65_29]